jgi:uncharacterized protein YjbI with pentapeptide repeats
MVKLLLSLLLCAHADVILTGRYLRNYAINGYNGAVDTSYAQILHFEVKGSRLARILAYQLRAPGTIWTDSSALEADFSLAQLSNSVWQNADFGSVRFRDADLRGAQFTNVGMTACNFDQADLRGTKFVGSALVNCTFRSAKFNDSTLLPFDTATAVGLGMIYVP